MLTLEEVPNIRENMLFGLEQFEEHLDEFITHSNKARQTAEIWSTIDHEDNAFLVDLMIQAGLRIPAAGEVVRILANSAWQYRLGAILVPKFMDTWRFYGQFGMGFWA